MPQQSDNILQLLAGFAEQIGNRLTLADELARERETEGFERQQDFMDQSLEREYKRAQIGKLNRPETEKTYAPPTTLEGYATQQLAGGTSESDILAKIGGLRDLFKPPIDKAEDLMGKGRLEAGKAFLGGRKIAEPYTETDTYGTTLNKTRFIDAPFTQGASDSLMAILAGLPMGQEANNGEQGMSPDLDLATAQGLAIQQLRAEYPDFDSAPPEVQQAAIKKKLSGQ